MKRRIFRIQNLICGKSNGQILEKENSIGKSNMAQNKTNVDFLKSKNFIFENKRSNFEIKQNSLEKSKMAQNISNREFLKIKVKI